MNSGMTETDLLLSCFLVLTSCQVAFVTGCTNHKADVQFLVDTSGSVGGNGFHVLTDFIRQFSEFYSIGPNGVQVGVTTYASIVYPEFFLNRFQTHAALTAGLKSIKYRGGNTLLGEALKWINNNAFTKSSGDRPDVPNYVFIFGDGYPSDQTLALSMAKNLHSRNITVIVVDIRTTFLGPQQHGILPSVVTDQTYLFSGIRTSPPILLRNIQLVFNKTACQATTIAPPTTNHSFHGNCVNSKLVHCEDTHVCSDDTLKTYCPILCGLCVVTTPPPCADMIGSCIANQCSKSLYRNTYCRKTCGICSSLEPVVPELFG